MITQLQNQGDLKIHEHGITIHTFTIPECVPCRIINPIMDRIAGESKNIHVYRINSYLHPYLAKEHSIRSVPTAYFYKDGKLIKRMVGIMGIKHELESI